jgi:hypothetical protein
MLLLLLQQATATPFCQYCSLLVCVSLPNCYVLELLEQSTLCSHNELQTLPDYCCATSHHITVYVHSNRRTTSGYYLHVKLAEMCQRTTELHQTLAQSVT